MSRALDTLRKLNQKIWKYFSAILFGLYNIHVCRNDTIQGKTLRIFILLGNIKTYNNSQTFFFVFGRFIYKGNAGKAGKLLIRLSACCCYFSKDKRLGGNYCINFFLSYYWLSLCIVSVCFNGFHLRIVSTWHLQIFTMISAFTS